METFISKYLFEIGLFFVALLFVSLFSIPAIFLAQKEPLLFSDFYSKRALFFSIGNAVFITILLVALSVFFTITIPDENAGGAMMFLVGSLKIWH